MKIRVVLLGLGLLLVPFASGQSPLPLPGVRVISSGYDANTHIAKIVFQNDSDKNITAYHLTLRTTYRDGSQTLDMRGEDCLLGDIYYQIESKRRVSTDFSTPPRSIRPGETRQDTRDLNLITNGHNSGFDVKEATLTMDFVAFSDRSVQFTNSDAFDRTVATREVAAFAAQHVADIGKAILSRVSADNQNLLKELIAEIRKAARDEEVGLDRQAKNRAHALDTVAYYLEDSGLGTQWDTLKHDYHHKASNPGNPTEREVLTGFIAEKEEEASLWTEASKLEVRQ